MATSVYFNNQGATREQFLIEDMIIESIRNHGIDIYYLPRGSQSAQDELFGDDPVKAFPVAVKIDMYLETFDDFTGNQEFFSKFGLEIQKAAKVAVARRTFQRYVGNYRLLPKEGDLIFLPVQQKILEIKFVEEEKNFFQAGKVAPYMFGLSLETFKYNGELFTTGVKEIDDIGNAEAVAIELTLINGGSGTFIKNETVTQGTTLAYVEDWDGVNFKLKVRNVRGTFDEGSNVTGVKSGAVWTILSRDEMENANSEYDDNTRIESEADNILDWSELNPFGSPNET